MMNRSARRKLVFMGSDAIALPALEFLAEQRDALEIRAVYTQPDRRTGRGKKLQPNAIKRWALDRGIEVRQPEKVNDAERDWLEENRIDLVLVMAYGQILRRSFIETPRLHTFNLHASLLPKFRGASPIEAAIASGETENGVTLMRMVRRLDAGPIVDSEGFPIERLETGQSATGKIADACVPLLKRNLPNMLAGNAPVEEQPEEEATYTRKLTKQDGTLDFSAPAEILARRINALFPWPGCFVALGDQRIKIGLADWSSETASAEPGTFLGSDARGLQVATPAGTLLLLLLQRPGGRMLNAADFLRGFPVPEKTVFPSAPMPPLVSDKPFPWLPRK